MPNQASPTPRDTHAPKLKLFSRIALVTSLLAALVLGLVVVFVSADGGETYRDMTRATSLARRDLGPALIVAGLFLVATTSFITWLVCLYGTFRVAGPLYRFCRNLERASTAETVRHIRAGDSLQDVSRQLLASVHAVRGHRARLRDAVDTALRELDNAGDTVQARCTGAIGRIQERAADVRIDA